MTAEEIVEKYAGDFPDVEGRKNFKTWEEPRSQMLIDVKAYAEQCLREAAEKIETEISDYIYKRDGWKEGTDKYETYDLVVRVLTKRKQDLLSIIDELK